MQAALSGYLTIWSVIAGRYHVGTMLARDAIFVSTIASVPVIVSASTWLR